MLLRVDPNLPVPVYEQIRSQLARLSASGQLAAGTRLPTIRQLASDLGLAKGTVERAYLLLEADGVVDGRGRAGTFLRARSKRTASEEADGLRELEDAADAVAVLSRQLGVDTAEAVAALRRALTRLG